MMHAFLTKALFTSLASSIFFKRRFLKKTIEVGVTLDYCLLSSFIPYQTFDEAIEFVNYSEYGLQAGILTNNVNLVWKAARRIQTGGVNINDTSSYRADHMPYGGIDKSGAGREGPHFAVEEMSEIRMVVFNLQDEGNLTF